MVCEPERVWDGVGLVVGISLSVFDWLGDWVSDIVCVMLDVLL